MPDRAAGLRQGRAAQMVGVHRQTVNSWGKRHRAQGEEGVLDGRRASPRRGQGILSADEAQQIRAWIVGQTPDQRGRPFGLWTSRAAAGELIARRFGKRLGLTTVQLHRQRWGMSPQKPLVRAKQRQPAAIHRGLAGDDLSGDCEAGQGEAGGRAVICWGDETGISNHQASEDA